MAIAGRPRKPALHTLADRQRSSGRRGIMPKDLGSALACCGGIGSEAVSFSPPPVVMV